MAVIPSVVFFDFGNIGPTPIMIVLLSDGSLQQVNTSTLVVAQIAAPGTVLNPTLGQIGISQWGSQYIIIVANQTNGYWLWDGKNFFEAGTLGPDVNLVNSGLDYTSQPSITAFGGTGSGASFSSVIQSNFVELVSILNPGIGYTLTDGVVLAFNGGGSPGRTATAVGTIAGGSVTGLSFTDHGAGYTGAATGTFLGGGGVGAEISLTASGGQITGGSLISGGGGYTAPPTLFVVDPNNPVAQASIDVMPFGIQGTAAETFQSRVWVVLGSLVQFTAPTSVVDFATSDGGGAFRATDSYLRVGYTQPRQTNGFLFLVADSSMDYISSPKTSGNPPTTTFVKQNADAETGTPYAPTVDVLNRNVVFANAFGVHLSYGGAVTKISAALDGVFNSVPNFGGFVLSAAKAIIFGKRVFMVLVPIIDPITKLQSNKLLMMIDERDKVRWFSSDQDVSLTYIASQEINSVQTAYGTDGNSIFPLFQKPSTGFFKTVQSKLWDAPVGYTHLKAATRLWGMVYYYAIDNSTLNVSVDNEVATSNNTITLTPNVITIVNALGNPVTVVNVLGAVVVVLSLTGGVFVFPPTAVAQNGVVTGLTLKTNASDMAVISLAVEDEIAGYRG